MAQPLLKAIQKDAADKIPKLAQKVDINEPVNGSTFLIKALTSEECAFAILDVEGVDVNLVDAAHLSPLSHAVLAESPELVQALLDRGARVAAGPDGMTPVHWAAEVNQTSSLEALLQSAPEWFDAARADGATPLRLACVGATEAALWLLASRADPTYVDARGDTLVHTALQAKLSQVVVALADRLPAAHLARANVAGDTCLHVACRMRTPDVVMEKLVAKSELALEGPSAPRNAAGLTPHQVRAQLLLEAEAETARAREEQHAAREAKKEKQRLEYEAGLEASEVTSWLREQELGHLAEAVYAKGATRLAHVAAVAAPKAWAKADLDKFTAAQKELAATLPAAPLECKECKDQKVSHKSAPAVHNKGYPAVAKGSASKDFTFSKTAKGSASSTSKGAATNYIKP